MRHALQNLARRIRLLVNRAAITGSDDAGEVQRVQLKLLGSEVLDRIEHLQPFGLASRASEGAEAIAASIGGSRGHVVAILVADRRYRKKDLEKGEAALHNQWGDIVYLREDGTIVVTARTAVQVTAPAVTVQASDKITLDTPLVECTGNLKAAGNIEDASGAMQEMRDVYNQHKHTDVTPGSGTSGTPDTPQE